MTIDSNTTTTTADTESMLAKMAKAGDVQSDDAETEEQPAQTVVVSTVEDLTAVLQNAVQTLAGTQPEVGEPATAPTPVAAPTKKKTKKKAKAKAKATVKKAAAKKETKHVPTSGQSGPPIKDLEVADLNDKELKLMKVFPIKGDREVFTITQLAKGAWPTNTQGKSNSWTRNSLRRLVRGGFITKLSRGRYQISVKGRNRMEKALMKPSKASSAKAAA